MTVTAACYLLASPPEPRNRIYEYIYPKTKVVKLLECDLLRSSTDVPWKALLLTCRQIFEEARLVYRAVWDGTEFTIEANSWYVPAVRGGALRSGDSR